jgi:hypothetical protein
LPPAARGKDGRVEVKKGRRVEHKKVKKKIEGFDTLFAYKFQ